MNKYEMRVRLWQKIARLHRLNMVLLGICAVIALIQFCLALASTVISWLYLPFAVLLVSVYLSMKCIRRHHAALAEIHIDPQEVTFTP